MAELVLKEEVYQVTGAAMEVYWQLCRVSPTDLSGSI